MYSVGEIFLTSMITTDDIRASLSDLSFDRSDQIRTLTFGEIWIDDHHEFILSHSSCGLVSLCPVAKEGNK
jgi:hypothetical protein